MADPAKTDPDKAYEMFTKALRRGQAGLDELDPEIKKMAMGPAEASLGAPSWSDPTDPSSEGYDIVEEVAPPTKRTTYVGGDTVKEDPSAEGYYPIEAVAPPDPNAGKAYRGREKYKTFRMPKGMSDEQISSWKGAIDDSLIEQDLTNADQARFEAGRSQFYESSDSKATDALGSLLAMGAAAAAGTGGAQLAGAVLGASDDALTGSAEAAAGRAKMTGMGKVGRDTKALSKAEKALASANPYMPDPYGFMDPKTHPLAAAGQKPWEQAEKAGEAVGRMIKPGEVYGDIQGGFRKSPGFERAITSARAGGFPVKKPAFTAIPDRIYWSIQDTIENMPKISSDEVKRGIKAATDARDIAATTLEASKEAYKDVAARAVALQDARITTGLKMFGKKAAATATIAASPYLAAAVSTLGIPIIAMSELAKHGKINAMLETMSYRVLERPVAYGDVGDSVHSYLIQNPTEAEELYSKGAIDADYYEWVAESAGDSPDVILDTLPQ